MPDIPSMPAIVVFATLAMLYVSLVHRSEPAVRYWALAYVLLAFGGGFAVLRDHLPASLSIVVGITLLVCGFLLIYAGTATFCRRRVAWRTIGVVAVTFAAAMFYWTVVAPSQQARLLSFGVALCIACALMLRELLRSSSGSQRLTFRLVAAVYGIFLLTTIVRMATSLVGDGAIAADRALIGAIWFASGQAVIFFSPFGFLLMTSQRLQLRLDRLASRDELTGILNRRAFLTEAGASMQVGSAERPVAVLVLDIDRFKQLNDRYGHAAGDAVLRAFANTVTRQLRRKDLFARVGGEEFWILPADVDLDGATSLAERIRSGVASAQVMHGRDALRITVSIGVSTILSGDVTAALSAADAALYEAKSGGRNRVVVTTGTRPAQRTAVSHIGH